MPPFKGLPKSESAARDQGLVTLTSFFTVKQSRGRPTKKTSNAGRPASEKTATPTDPVPVPPAATLKPNKEKAKRMSYSSGEGLEKMTGAVKAWEDEQRKPAEQQMSMKKFAKAWEIPFSTLQNHVCPDDSKRIKLGSSVGKTPIIGSAEKKVIVDVLIRKDRANEGVGVDGAVDILEQMLPNCSRKQLDGAFRRTVRPQNKEYLTGSVSAQKTTTQRSAITVAQQWRWHKVNLILVNHFRSSILWVNSFHFTFCFRIFLWAVH